MRQGAHPPPPPFAARGPWPPPPPITQLRPHFLPPPPLFAYTPRYFPPPPPPHTRPEPADQEALWLQSFERTHLPPASADDAPSEPPLRRLRAAIATAQTLIAQLRTAASDALAAETRVRELEAEAEGDAIAQLELSRLRLQRDRKLATCAALRTQLEAMDAATLFCRSEDELADVTRLALLAKKKQVYRKKAKKRRRVEATVLGGMRAATSSERADGDASSTEEVVAVNAAAAAATCSTKQTRVDTAAAEREQARKVLVLLEIKEQRAGVLSDDDRQEIAEMRAAATKCLERKPRRTEAEAARPAKLPRAPPQAQTANAIAKQESGSSASRELADPETIDMKALVAVRRAWDQFLVPPHTFPGSSTIPPHFVPPPATPSARWSVFLNTT